MPLVQSKAGQSTLASTTVAFDTAPTPGNLIILSFVGDAYNAGADTGWTESAQMGLRTSSNHGAYKWWRKALDSTNSFSYTLTAPVKSAWVLEEWSGLDPSSPYDVSVSQFSNGGSTGYTSADLTPTAGGRLIHEGIAGSTSGGLGLPGAWTGGFSEVASALTTGGGVELTIGTAALSVTADGSTPYGTSATFAAGFPSRSALSIAFKFATPASPVFSVAPAITGTAQVGATLTLNSGIVTGYPIPAVTRQWQRDNDGGLAFADIPGATGTTLVLSEADRYCNIRCLVEAENSEGDEITSSNTIGPIAAAPLQFTVRLSGGASNTDPAASYGGAESSHAASGPLLFDSLSADEAGAGVVDYRCVYFHNEETVKAATVIAYLVDDTSFPGRPYFAVGAATQAAGVTATAGANDHATPAGVTFNQGTTSGTGVNLGTISAGLGKGVFIRRTVPALTPSGVPHNEVRVRFEITEVE